MIENVEWTPEAELTYGRVISEIGERWTGKEIENFVARTEQVIGFIRQNPNMYAYSKKGLVHRAVISRQTSLYYRFTESKIILLSFEDNRQNPTKLRY